MQRAEGRLLIGLLALLGCLSWCAPASAYPWMIRHGFSDCRSCHTDPTGGELLTTLGRIQGTQLLSFRYDPGGEGEEDEYDEDEEVAEPWPPGPLWGLISTPPELHLGGAYRQALLAEPASGKLVTFPMQADLFGQLRLHGLRAGGSLGVAKVPPGSPHARPAQLTTAQGDAFNLISRYHWVGYDATPQLLIRGGRLNLPFGLRIPEHTAWVRESTRTDRESDQQHGLALSYSSYRVRGEIMAIAGNYQIHPDRYRERGYSLFVESIPAPFLAVGVSSLVTRALGDPATLEPIGTTRQAHGAFTRARLPGSVVLLGEANWTLESRRDAGFSIFAQLDLEPLQGLHVMLTGEARDEGYLRRRRGKPARAQRAPGFGEPQFGGWLSAAWFFWPQLQLRVDAMLRQTQPFQLLSQLHLYL